MMKKTAVLFVLITALLFTSIFTGCRSNNAGSSGNSDTNSDTSGQADASGKAETPGQTDVSGKTGNSSPTNATDNSKIPDTEESAVSDWGVAAAPGRTRDTETGSSAAGTDFIRTIADRDDFLFAIKDASTDSSSGYSWKLYIENRTDKNLLFSFEKVSVNGVMCDPFWAEVVMAGKKGTCEIMWMRDTLEERQISEVAQVDFTLNVCNDDDYAEAPLMHEQFTVCPHGENMSLGENKSEESGEQYAPLEHQPSETDIVLIDNDDCAIIVTGFDPENSWGYAVHLYLHNKTEEDLIFATENTSVNGVMCESLWTEIVTAGHSAVSTILWDTASLHEKEISEVSEISLPMKVYSDKDIANPYVEETFELTP